MDMENIRFPILAGKGGDSTSPGGREYYERRLIID